MLGIVVGWFFSVNIQYVLALSAVALVATLAGLHPKASRSLFGVSAMAVMFLLGVFVEHCQSEKMRPQWSGEKQNYLATLLEVPALRGTNAKVLAHVTLCDTAVLCNVRHSGDVYLYFQRTVDTDLLQVGDNITFETVINPPANAGNPAEFDVENFYYIKGITGTAYLWDGTWACLSRSQPGIVASALHKRGELISQYQSSGFENEGLALLSALTLGEKRDLPQELKENYSAAGVGHLLALSGLHLGVLYVLIVFIIPLRGGNRWWWFARELVVVSLLWAFAFVAGLSPSVVRAAILFTLISLGNSLGQSSSSLNSLSFAAVVMLLFSPHLLFDVGFQLSFAAVLSILLLAPPMQRLMKLDERGTLYKYIANLFILSIAAQVGTFPLVWYYFGAFPLYFLLTNIFVVPLAFLVILLALLFWLLFLPILREPVAWLLEKLLEFMNFVVNSIAGLPGASCQLPALELSGAVCLAAFMLFALWALLQKRWRALALVSACGLLFALFFVPVTEKNDDTDYLLVYNNNKNPLLHAVSGCGVNYLLSTVPQLDAEFENVSTPYVNRERLQQPLWADVGYCDSLLVRSWDKVSFSGFVLGVVDNDIWQESLYSQPVDALLLCRGFKGGVAELLDVYPTECLLLDGSLYKHSRKRILRECAQLGVGVVDISQSGAVKIIPGTDSFELEFVRGK